MPSVSILPYVLPPDCLSVHGVLACGMALLLQTILYESALPDKTAKENVQLEALSEAEHRPGLACSYGAHLLPLSGMMLKP